VRPTGCSEPDPSHDLDAEVAALQLVEVLSLLSKPLPYRGVTVLRVKSEEPGILLSVSHREPSGYPQQPGTTLLRRAEVERQLRVSRATLWRLVRSGALPAVYLDRRPRFRPEDIRALVIGRTRLPTPEHEERVKDDSSTS
jgi:hypothetical protein